MKQNIDTPAQANIFKIQHNFESSRIKYSGMQNKPKSNDNPVFKPQDRYYVNEQGWWFYTVDVISGPYPTKPECVDACRHYIQKRAGLL